MNPFLASDARPRRRLSGDDYRMTHRPPDADSGAPLFDLTANGIYPKDVYDRPDWYSGGEANFWEAFDVVARRRNKPAARLWMFRALPCDAPRQITPGDWVTTVRSYAMQHAKGTDPSQDMCVIAARTEARCLHTDGNSLFEWGYTCPTPVKGKLSHRPRRGRVRRKPLTPRQRENRAERERWRL